MYVRINSRRRGLTTRADGASRSSGFSSSPTVWRVVSPYARKGPVLSHRAAEHTSTLKFLEKLHGLPTLASQNRLFDSGTPAGSNYQTGGAPAPPRDAQEDISDLLDCFEF